MQADIIHAIRRRLMNSLKQVILNTVLDCLTLYDRSRSIIHLTVNQQWQTEPSSIVEVLLLERAFRVISPRSETPRLITSLLSLSARLRYATLYGAPATRTFQASGYVMSRPALNEMLLTRTSKMIVGYIVENVVGLILASLLYITLEKTTNERRKNPPKSLDRYISVLRRGCSSFYDCAVFFTFSIQLACIVVLARLDFGINASGMGDSTAKITWAVSLLTILPPMYVAFNPGPLREPQPEPAGTPKGEKSKNRKEQLRFLLFALCWLLFIYPFLSRMMETFGQSAINNHQIISANEWNSIEASCTAGVDTVSDQELLAMNIFSVAGSVFVGLMTLTKIIWLALQRHHEDSRLVRRVHGVWFQNRIRLRRLPLALFVAIPIIAASQLWIVFRLRGFQKQVARNAGNYDSDGQWTFGQIAAVTIFVPVAVECCFAWLYE